MHKVHTRIEETDGAQYTYIRRAEMIIGSNTVAGSHTGRNHRIMEQARIEPTLFR